jgi:hypothetical protein
MTEDEKIREQILMSARYLLEDLTAIVGDNQAKKIVASIQTLVLFMIDERLKPS